MKKIRKTKSEESSVAIIRTIFKRIRDRNGSTHSRTRGTDTSSLTRKPTGSLEAEIFSMKSTMLI